MFTIKNKNFIYENRVKYNTLAEFVARTKTVHKKKKSYCAWAL